MSGCEVKSELYNEGVMGKAIESAIESVPAKGTHISVELPLIDGIGQGAEF